jgi:hypothetical protein
LQDDNVLSFEHRLEFFHTVQVHDRASADAEKFLWVELLLQPIQ